MPLSDRRRRLLLRLHQRRFRVREGLVLVEGIRAVGEALAAGAKLRFACATEDALHGEGARAVWDQAVRSGADAQVVNEREMASLAGTATPQGIALVFEEPKPQLQQAVRGPLCLVLDGVRDPGNVGTLVRAAAAFGAGGVVALDGSADPWGTKAVRASAGMAFRLPVVSASWAESASALDAAGATLVLADAGGEGPPWSLAPPLALIVGGEREGARAEVRMAAHHTVALPMTGGAESLNAAMAGTVLLWELCGVRRA